MQKETQLWSYIKEIYKTKLGIPEEICNLLSVDVVLIGVVSGLSVRHISECTHLGENLVIGFTREYFKDFIGWKNSLDFSPIRVYNRVSNFEEFIKEANSQDSIEDIKLSGELCKQYKELENKLKEYGYC